MRLERSLPLLGLLLCAGEYSWPEACGDQGVAARGLRRRKHMSVRLSSPSTCSNVFCKQHVQHLWSWCSLE